MNTHLYVELGWPTLLVMIRFGGSLRGLESPII